jgi:SNF2 family DNA or RNA helicase
MPKNIKVEMTDVQHEKYLDALAGLLEVVKADGESEEKEVTKLTAVTFCQQIVNHPELIGAVGTSNKVDALIDILTEGDLAGEKVIIYSRFRKMVDILMRELEKAKVTAVRITGAENEMQRKAAQDAFQKPDSGIQVICITSAAAEAINLQAAKAVVFYDSPWSAGEYIQILGRMIRIGSIHDRVYAVHLISTFPASKTPTIDQRVQDVLKKKMALVESVLGKRVKGEAEDTIEVAIENEISDLFASLQLDAKEQKR